MEENREKLIQYAYNILGSYEDAKDVAQETMRKFLVMDTSHVQDSSNYLIKMAINEAINLQKKQKRTVKYGTWLPEPIVTSVETSSIEKEYVINYSLLVLFEKLNARERAVFVLKEVFDYDHKHISELHEINEANSRQLLTRAKKKIQSQPLNKTPSAKIALLEPYMNAIKNGDIQTLEKLLAHDVEVHADGGDKIQVVVAQLKGRNEVIPLMIKIFNAFQKKQTFQFSSINKQPAILYYEDDKLVNCQVFSIENGQITQIFSVLNPNKIERI